MKKSALLVINAGSATLKHALFDAETLLRLDHGTHEHDGSSSGVSACLAEILAESSAHQIVAVGHRVVHGGSEFSVPARIDIRTLAALEALIPLAPLHQPHNVAGIRAAMAALPGVPQVACFDTAFHRTQPELTQHYGLPRSYFNAGIRRYGFHGLSYESIAAQLPEHLGDLADGRVVVAHLGNGASLCALHQRRSVATTMGFSTLDGLLMGTRCGQLDPGVLLYLMEQHHMDSQALTQLLYKESGLLGLSGIASDMRTLLDSKAAEAALAIDFFCQRITHEIGALTVALGGVDALVFTGGIGENAAAIRDRITHTLAWMKIAHTCVIPCNEEGIIAGHARRLVN